MATIRESPTFRILVDADANPVKQEVYRVALRFGLKVVLVANSPMNVKREDWLELVVVGSQLDAADDWIAEHAEKNDIVVTGDIPLASRSLKRDARAISPRGVIFTERSIGDVVATRDLMTRLRDMGIETGGPRAFEKKDRSRFLQSLDHIIQTIIRSD